MAGSRISSRLTDYDYRFGTFFVSLVAAGRAPMFGHISNGSVTLSPLGEIVRDEWLRTPMIRPTVQLDEWIVMPDHFQAIVCMTDGENSETSVGGASWRPCQEGDGSIQDDSIRIRSIQPLNHSLPRLVSQFKATTTRLINEYRNTPGQPVWQRGYHDRIVRGEPELRRTRTYIRNNPKNAQFLTKSA